MLILFFLLLRSKIVCPVYDYENKIQINSIETIQEQNVNSLILS